MSLNKTCICKKDFRMNNTNVGWNLDFKKNQQYYYSISKNKESLIDIFYVSDGEINDFFKGVPFVEKKFKELFDNTQEDRNDKLKKLLYD